jgi:pilus assembly protein CpaB
VDQGADQDSNRPTIARTVTVEASPRNVAALTQAQAQATGRLSLSLLGAQDDVFRVEVVKEKVCTIRTRRGGEIVETPIPCTN